MRSVLLVVLATAVVGCSDRRAAPVASPKSSPAPPPEQTYNGRTAEQWAKLFADPTRDMSRDAEAVPALFAILLHEDPVARAWAAQSLGVVSAKTPDVVPALVRALGDKDEAVKTAAADSLARIGEPAIALLIATLKKGEEVSSYYPIRALGKIGAPAVPPLLAGVKGATEHERRLTTEALQKIGEPAVPALLAVLKDGTADEVKQASDALRMPAAIPYLRKALADPDVKVRRGAALALGGLSAWANAVPPELSAALADADPSVRAAAVSALARIEPRTGTVFDLLAAARLDPKPEVRLAAYGQSRFIKELPDAEAVFVGALQDGSPEVRREAVYGLSRVPNLLKALKDPDPEVRKTAVYCLNRTGDRLSGVPNLLNTLKDPDPEVRERAEWALKDMSGADYLLKGLLPALKDEDHEVRRFAAMLLSERVSRNPAQISAQDDRSAVVAAMMAAFKDHRSGVQDYVAEALPHLMPESAVSIPMFVEALKKVDFAAQKAVAKFGVAAIPALAAAIDDKDVTLRRNAVGVLAVIYQNHGAKAGAAEPLLKKAQGSSDSVVRDHAMRALERAKTNK